MDIAEVLSHPLPQRRRVVVVMPTLSESEEIFEQILDAVAGSEQIECARRVYGRKAIYWKAGGTIDFTSTAAIRGGSLRGRTVVDLVLMHPQDVVSLDPELRRIFAMLRPSPGADLANTEFMTTAARFRWPWA